MKLYSNHFFENLQGNWISQKNIYFLTTKQQNKYKEQISIIKYNKEVNISQDKLYQYKIYIASKKDQSNQQYSNLNICEQKIIKEVNKVNKLYDIHFISSDLLKIQLNSLHNNFIYDEYIYSINPNFKISISILKKSNKYIATILTSYIRKPIVIK